MLTLPHFSAQNHHVRAYMVHQQQDLLQNHDICSHWLRTGLELAPILQDTIPNVYMLSQTLFHYTGRTLCDAENPYLDAHTWYDHLLHRRFPVTNYIRTYKDLAFTPLPDLFHEYFGHMPQMFIPRLANLQEKFALLFQMCTTTTEKDWVYRLARYSTEYGFLYEQGKEKIFGAGLLSSVGDLQRAVEKKFLLLPASLQSIIHTPHSPHVPHTSLFVFNSLQHIEDLIEELAILLQKDKKKQYMHTNTKVTYAVGK